MKGSQVLIFKFDCINLCLKSIFNLANSADPIEMLDYAAFHLGLHCLPRYMFMEIH